MAKCRHCNRPLEEIEPGRYDECERCAAEGLWQCDVELVDDDPTWPIVED